MTLAGSITTLLGTAWALTGDLASTKIHFDTGWYDQTQEKPQIIVSELSNPKGMFYGTSTIDFYPRYVVNCWVKIPPGEDGATKMGTIESMRQEVARIINANRHSINSFEIIVPLDEGTPLHELDRVPQILRYEIVVFGVREIS